MADTPNFAQVLAHLRDQTQPFPATELYLFSDLGRNDVAALEAAWPDVPLERRRNLLQDLGEIGEANYEVRFDPVFELALDDEDEAVRALAINNLWESEAPRLMAPFIDLLQNDPSPLVRAAAASALGRFVYLGAVEEITPTQLRRVEEALLAAIAQAPDLEVRRRALEAIAFSSRPEVPGLIEQAYQAADSAMRVSAVFAMGRTADGRWEPEVLKELESADPEVRFEAVRAAGELELPSSVPALKTALADGDIQVREAAIWSLGQIGGDEARTALMDELDSSEDDDEREYIEEALENLAFHDDMLEFSMLDFEDQDDADDFGDDEDDEFALKNRLN
jgi:HEAT repeat protein